MPNFKKSRIFFLLIAPIFFQCEKNIIAGPEVFEIPEVITKANLNIKYGTRSKNQNLDIFLPEKGGVFPVVVYIHGTAWSSGSKDLKAANALPILAPLLAKNYAVVSINYRLSGEATHPAQIFDVQSAIRWIKANAKKYNLNADKIGVWGASSGGHLAALLATCAGNENLLDIQLDNPKFSSKVQVAVDWYGQTDFLKMNAQAKEQNCSVLNHDKIDSPESKLIGFPIQSKPTISATANPITYISKETPPIFIQHGLADCTVPYAQSQILYDALIKVKSKEDVKLKLLPGAEHGGKQFITETNITETINFLDKYLK